MAQAGPGVPVPQDFQNLMNTSFDPFNVGSYFGVNDRSNKALKFFEVLQVIPDRGAVYYCPIGNGQLRSYVDQSRARGWRFRCPQRHVAYEATHNTFLEQAQLNVLGADVIASLIYYWVIGLDVTATANLARVGSDTAVAWYGYCRDVAGKNAWHAFQQIGGPTDVVEVDETHLFKRKYNVGRLTMYEHVYLFGGISRTTKQVFGMIVPDRTQDTLLQLMQSYIHPETYVCTDMFRSYVHVEDVFSGHGVVNHSTNFLNPPREQEPLWVPVGRFDRTCLDKQWRGEIPQGFAPFRNHTQNIEIAWRGMKGILRSCTRINLAENYVGEWMYRKNILNKIPDLSDRYLKFMQDIKRAYPGIGRKKMNATLEECDCYICEPP